MIDITSNKDEIVRELGHRLAQKRLAMGWTQEELALRAGVENFRISEGDVDEQLHVERLSELVIPKVVGRLVIKCQSMVTVCRTRSGA